jgi:hypothetical protein
MCPHIRVIDLLRAGETLNSLRHRGGAREDSMPVVVIVHRLKDVDEWLKLFKANPPPKVGRWRLFRASDDHKRIHVVGEVAASEVKTVKDFVESKHMQDVFKRVNAMSTAPIEAIWLEELTP